MLHSCTSLDSNIGSYYNFPGAGLHPWNYGPVSRKVAFPKFTMCDTVKHFLFARTLVLCKFVRA